MSPQAEAASSDAVKTHMKQIKNGKELLCDWPYKQIQQETEAVLLPTAESKRRLFYIHF